MDNKRLTLFAGHYGSGKTNIAVNYALELAKKGKQVCIADLDIVNPYFRTADSAKELSDAGVTLIAPQFANTNVDLPSLPSEAYRLIADKSIYGIMDIGGDDRGAYALGRYAPSILEENNYRMVYVANCCRPLTATPEDALEVMREIEIACSMKFTHLINNANLGNETNPETVLGSVEFINKLSVLSGLPVWRHCVKADIAEDVSKQLENVFPLHLQKKYFDLPTQTPGNRPMWG